ncbi:MAG: ribonuclease P protein component [Patescibacteria group bacterium]
MALPAAVRFRDRREIARVLRGGVRVVTPIGRAVILPAGRGGGHILFVVSTKMSKKSSRRHWIRRQLDEWVRAHWGASPALTRFDTVVFVSPDAATSSRQELLWRAGAAFALLSRRYP